jgi:hypothetical protein
MLQTAATATTAERKFGVRPCVWVMGFTLLFFSGVSSSPAALEEDSDGPGTSSVMRFLALREEPLRQYRAYRRMHAQCDRMDQEGWVEAWTEYDGRGFRYEIVSERGSETVRNKVLKTVLRREQELVAKGEDARGALTTSNYEFEDAAVENGMRYVILKPKRKDALLVDGRMVLSQDGRDLLRVEGRLAKNPSFWTSLVDIIRHYARLDGVRVPVAVESVAKVKFAGLSRMDVHYEYNTINGRPVSLSARQISANIPR